MNNCLNNNCLTKIISYFQNNSQIIVSKNYKNEELIEINDSIYEYNKKQHTIYDKCCYCCLICTHIISSQPIRS